MEEMTKMKLCAMWLIKKLLLDTNAKKATITQDMTHEDIYIGTYKITIEHVEDNETDTR